MKNRWGLRLIGLLAVSCVAMSGVSLAVEPGSATDPLITLSYLNETFMGQIMDRVDQKIAQRNSGLGQSGAGVEFSVVTLSKGQVLTGDIGCEVMLRVGSATCVAASTPGLVDETSGSTLSGGGALDPGKNYFVISGGGTVSQVSGEKLYSISGSGTIRPVEEAGEDGSPDVPSGAQVTVSGGSFTFRGSGNGHQLGLSQYGAWAMAERGFSYDEIIEFYYPGAVVR